jgi:hypothetical protein
MIDFLDNCIRILQLEDNKQNDALHADKQDVLLKLIEKKKQIEQSRKFKRQAPKAPSDLDSNISFKETHPTIMGDITEMNPISLPSGSRSIIQTNLHTSANVDTIELQYQPIGSKQHIQSFPHQSSSDTMQRVQTQVTEVRKSSSQGSIRNISNNSPVKNKSVKNSSPAKSNSSIKISSSLQAINSRSAYQLLDQVRKHTQLSHEMSKVAVTVVVSGLRQLLPETVSHYFDALLHQLQTPLSVSKMSIEETYDANRMKVIFTELTSCKEDSQQRSWMLYEDESIIVEYIKELTEILVHILFYKIM